jgi:hypothetical protein
MVTKKKLMIQTLRNLFDNKNNYKIINSNAVFLYKAISKNFIYKKLFIIYSTTNKYSN